MNTNGQKIDDQLIKLPISQLKAQGLLHPGTHKRSFEFSDEVMGFDLLVEMGEDRIGCVTFTQCNFSTMEKYEYTIFIQPVRCHYGGFRHFFRCPMCRQGTEKLGRRASVLYFNSRYFVCRECCGVVYRSRIQPARYKKQKEAGK